MLDVFVVLSQSLDHLLRTFLEPDESYLLAISDTLWNDLLFVTLLDDFAKIIVGLINVVVVPILRV